MDLMHVTYNIMKIGRLSEVIENENNKMEVASCTVPFYIFHLFV